MPLFIIRIIFVILSSVSGYIIVQNVSDAPTEGQSFQGVALGIAIPIIIFALEVILRKYFLDAVAGILFGVTAGFILSFIILQSLNLVTASHEIVSHFQIPTILIVCYLCVALVLQTKNKFKFIIPYVDFRSNSKSPDYLILDSSGIIDRRVFSLLKLKMFTEQVLIPQFVVDELQQLSDSQDKLKREKGKKALNTIEKIRNDPFYNIEVHYDQFPEAEGADAKLIMLAKKINGRIVTTDSNLVMVCSIEDVPVLNIHEIAESFKPEMVVGEVIEVEIVKEGEKGKRQGVGYLPDGTMVVVENGSDKIGKRVTTEITNFVQTSSGKMVFSRAE